MTIFPPKQKTGKVINHMPGKNYYKDDYGHIVFNY